MHCHHSLLQIFACTSQVVMTTKNIVYASYHARDCTLIKLLSVADIFTKGISKPLITVLVFRGNRLLCKGSFCAFRANLVKTSDLRVSSRGSWVMDKALL